jgi:HK97 family phage major capsid protein
MHAAKHHQTLHIGNPYRDKTMKAIELREQRAKLVADANALVPKDMKDFTSELRTKVETMLADARGLDTIIASFEQEEQRSDEARAKNLNLSDTGSSDAVDKDATKAAFRSYLRTGKSEARDLTVSADGILIPAFVAQPVVAKKSPGAIYNIVGKMATSTGAPVKVPYWNDLANSWVLNSAGLATTDPTVSAGPTVTIDDLRFQPLKLDNSLVQDAAFDIVGQVVSDIYTRYIRNVSQWITLGNSSNIAGLTTITAGVTSAASGTVTYADVVKFITYLDPAYTPNAALTFNTTTLGYVLEIVDGNQRPIFVPYTDAPTVGAVGGILGYPVRINQFLPNVAASNVAMQFGDFEQGYKLNEVQPGIRVKVLDQLYAATNEVGYVAFARAGGVVLNAASGQQSPIISLTVHA